MSLITRPIQHRQDLTPEQLSTVCDTILKENNDAGIYSAGVVKLAEMVGWERLPDARHLIHEILGRTTPSLQRPVIASTPMEGWLLDFGMHTHEPMSSTPYDPHLGVWDEYALDFSDPMKDDRSAEFRAELVRLFNGERTAIRSEYVWDIWEAEKDASIEICDEPEVSIERFRSGTQGKIDLLFYPPPQVGNTHEKDIINAILLQQHTGCTWEKLLSAPAPWTVTPEAMETAKRWSEDGTWEEKRKRVKVVKYKDEPRRPDEPFILRFPMHRRKSPETIFVGLNQPRIEEHERVCTIPS